MFLREKKNKNENKKIKKSKKVLTNQIKYGIIKTQRTENDTPKKTRKEINMHYDFSNLNIEVLNKLASFIANGGCTTNFTAADVGIYGVQAACLVRAGALATCGTIEKWVQINSDTMRKQPVNVYRLVVPYNELRDYIVNQRNGSVLCRIANTKAIIENLAAKLNLLADELDTLAKIPHI